MVAGINEALGLIESFCDGAPEGRRPLIGGDAPPAKKAKNVNLMLWELPLGQLLNPMGSSGVGIIG